MKSESKKILLKLARTAIEKYFEKNKYVETKPEDFLKPGENYTEINERKGVFVTLKKKSELRGCIGTFREDLPLWKIVQEVAISSAFHDPRFPPVSKEEVDELEIELSILEPMKEISDISEIILGKHGVYITRGERGGVLLPQVPQEYGMKTVEEFLSAVCRKAGLPQDCYKQKGTVIKTFTAEIIEEKR